MIVRLTNKIIHKSLIVFYGYPGIRTSVDLDFGRILAFRSSEKWYSANWSLGNWDGEEIKITNISIRRREEDPSGYKEITIPVVFYNNEAKIRAIAICPVLASIGVA